MKTTLELPDDLHRKVKVKVAQEGTTISEVVRSLLADWAIGSWAEAREYHEKVDAASLPDRIPVEEEIIPKSIKTLDAKVSPRSVVFTPNKARPMKDLSKSAQTKGKMGR